MNEARPARVKLVLIGATAGDIIGSRFERHPYKSIYFETFTDRNHFTDDSVLTIAIADAILNSRTYKDALVDWGRRYPHSGYGGAFRRWLKQEDPQPYNSFGNGSAMRSSAVGWAFNSAEEVLRHAEASASPSHDHPEGIKGAQATALGIFLARNGWSKEAIREEISGRFGYDLKCTVNDLRQTYTFDVTCQGTLPAALAAFLDSNSFEDAIRLAISLGGDADTLAAISGAVAEAYYSYVPEWIIEEVKKRLPGEMWIIIEEFSKKYG